MEDCDGAIVMLLVVCIEGEAELDNVVDVGGGDDKKVGCKVVGT